MMKRKTFCDLFFGITGGLSIVIILFNQITQKNILIRVLHQLIYMKNKFYENILYIIIGFILSIIVVLIINKLIKNKGNIYFNRSWLFSIALPLIILLSIFILKQIINLQQESFLTWWIFLLLIIFPLGFFSIFIGIATEYYKISNEILVIYKGIFNKVEEVNIKDIQKIDFKTDLSGEGVQCYYLLKTSGNKIFELNTRIDDIYGLINKILFKNNNIYIAIEAKIELEKLKQKLIDKVISIIISIILYTIDFYIIIKIINKWYYA